MPDKNDCFAIGGELWIHVPGGEVAILLSCKDIGLTLQMFDRLLVILPTRRQHQELLQEEGGGGLVNWTEGELMFL